MQLTFRLAAIAAALSLTACTSVPTGPSAMALPGSGKNFDQFRVDDRECRQYALQQSGASPNQSAEDSGVKSAAIGSAVGAIAGAAIDGSHGAAAGAGVGLLMGALIGTGTADQSSRMTQRRYDNGYIQCMYAKGHRVPVSSQYTGASSSQVRRPVTPAPSTPPAQSAPATPLAAGVPPPPPPGSPPPAANYIVQ